MNKEFMDMTELLGMGVGLFGILQLLNEGWQRASISVAVLVYLGLAIVAWGHWMRSGPRFLH